MPDRGRVEDNWYYLYVVMEEMYQYRFLYHNLDNILHRYPDIRRRFKRLLQLNAPPCSPSARPAGTIHHRRTGQQLLGLVDNMTLTMTFWFNYDQLLHDRVSPRWLFTRACSS